MKNAAFAISLAFLVCSAPLLRAQDDPAPAPIDPKRAAAAEALLKAMHIDQLMTKEKENMRKMMSSVLPKDLSPDARKQAEAAQAASLDAVFQQLTWESLKPDFIQMYSEVYTEKELKDLAAFYNSPIGQKFIEKMPELQAKTMELVQKRMKTLLPVMQAAASNAIDKDKAAGDSGDGGDQPPQPPPLPPQPPQP